MLAGLALVGWVLHALLAPRGFGWVVWTLGAFLAAFIALELVLRTRRRGADARDLERWSRAQADPHERREAIRELRSRLERARRFGPRFALEQARLSTVLAELLTADGRPEHAIAVLAKVPLDSLDDLQLGVVRHARAQAHLAAGDIEAAETTLATAPERTGEELLDASLALARAWVALASGNAHEADRAARAILEANEEGEELHDEALALLAASARARGEHESARALLARIDAEGRARLERVGPAPLRKMLLAMEKGEPI